MLNQLSTLAEGECGASKYPETVAIRRTPILHVRRRGWVELPKDNSYEDVAISDLYGKYQNVKLRMETLLL